MLARHYENLSDERFRWRSHEILRIEGLSDAVFGFAITLLIVSLEVPKTSTELFETMRGFGAFVITFIMLTGIWRAQFIFFRRYGLEDQVTVLLNLALLFTVLFFVYPLKFMFTIFFSDPTMRHFKVATEHGMELAILPQHRPWLYFIFGAGFTAIFLIFVLLHHHALRRRELLELNELEVYETRFSIGRQLCSVGIGVTYFVLAGAMSLPDKTREQRMLVIGILVLDLVVMVLLLFKLIRLQKQRRAYLDALPATSPQSPLN